VILACMVAEDELDIMAKVQHGDENGASVLAAQKVNAEVCAMKAEGALGDVMTPEADLQDVLIKVRFQGDNDIL